MVSSLNCAFLLNGSNALALFAPLAAPPLRLSLRPVPVRQSAPTVAATQSHVGGNGRGNPHRLSGNAPNAHGRGRGRQSEASYVNTPGRAPKWGRSPRWAPESWPVLLADWVARYVTAAVSPASDTRTLNSAASSSLSSNSSLPTLTSHPSASTLSRPVDIASSLYLAGAELVVDASDNWCLMVAPPAGHWRRMSQAARAADLLCDGDAAPNVFYVSFPRASIATQGLALKVASAAKKHFDPSGHLEWGPVTAYGDEFLIYGEAPTRFVPSAPFVTIRLPGEVPQSSVVCRCERRAATPTPLQSLSPGQSSPCHIVDQLPATRTLIAGRPQATSPAPQPATPAPTAQTAVSEQRATVSTNSMRPTSAPPQSQGPKPAVMSSPHGPSPINVTTPAVSTSHSPDTELPLGKRSRGRSRNPRGKFYAVAWGIRPGVFESWPEAKASVAGVKGAIHQSFESRQEAEAWLGTFDLRSLPAPAATASNAVAADASSPSDRHPPASSASLATRSSFPLAVTNPLIPVTAESRASYGASSAATSNTQKCDQAPAPLPSSPDPKNRSASTGNAVASATPRVTVPQQGTSLSRVLPLASSVVCDRVGATTTAVTTPAAGGNSFVDTEFGGHMSLDLY